MLKDSVYLIKVNNFYIKAIDRNYSGFEQHIVNLELTMYFTDAKPFRNYNSVIDIVKELGFGDIYNYYINETLHCKFEDLDLGE